MMAKEVVILERLKADMGKAGWVSNLKSICCDDVKGLCNMAHFSP
jgi:hypothetical protein